MPLNLDKIKERLLVASGQKKNTSDLSQIFWKVPEGESVVRVVNPDALEGDPFQEHFQHYSVGKNPPFLCPRKEFGETCPVCEYVSKLFKSQNPEDLALAKKISVKSRYFSPVMVRGEEDKGIRWWSYSKTVYVKLLKLINMVEDYGDITDPETGTDLVVSYETPKGASFPLTSFEPRRKTSPLCKDLTPDKCKEILDNIPNLSKGMSRKSSGDIKKMLDEWLLSDDEAGEDVHEEIEKFGKKEERKEVSKNDIDQAFDDLMKE